MLTGKFYLKWIYTDPCPHGIHSLKVLSPRKYFKVHIVSHSPEIYKVATQLMTETSNKLRYHKFQSNPLDGISMVHKRIIRN